MAWNKGLGVAGWRRLAMASCLAEGKATHLEHGLVVLCRLLLGGHVVAGMLVHGGGEGGVVVVLLGMPWMPGMRDVVVMEVMEVMELMGEVRRYLQRRRRLLLPPL